MGRSDGPTTVQFEPSAHAPFFETVGSRRSSRLEKRERSSVPKANHALKRVRKPAQLLLVVISSATIGNNIGNVIGPAPKSRLRRASRLQSKIVLLLPTVSQAKQL